jgi:hypothetical protein
VPQSSWSKHLLFILLPWSVSLVNAFTGPAQGPSTPLTKGENVWIVLVRVIAEIILLESFSE